MHPDRHLADVLDEMFELAPDLIEPLGSVRAGVVCASPEMQSYWWNEAAKILNQHATDHLKGEQLRMIFAGHERIARQIPQLARGQVWCLKCGATKRVDSAAALRHGWPTCCGSTMTIDSPEEQKKALK